MAVYKLVSEDEELNQNYTIVAIHCNLENYKLAFLLNKTLKIALVRQKEDFIPNYKHSEIFFPLFKYTNSLTHQTYYLVPNKTTSESQVTPNTGGLFENNVLLQKQTHYLVPEYKQTDYILKINTPLLPDEKLALQKQIKQMKQILSVYYIENNKIKTNKNLIIL